MFTVSVELLHGTFRGDPDGTGNTGRLERGEWPPSPARLFAALVAADGTRQQTRVTDGSELRWLEALPPPDIHAHRQAWHQAQQPRFVAAAGRAKGAHQEYVARSGRLHRPGVRVSPRDPCIVYQWGRTPPPEVLEPLRLRAARVGYLGASDAPVRLRVGTEIAADPPADVFTPDPGGEATVNVPRPGDTDLLDRIFDEWRGRGASVARSQFPALVHSARYRSSPSQQVEEDRGRVVVWMNVRPAVSGRRVCALTTLFKEAVLSHYQRIHGEPPSILHGHGFEESGYDLARFLGLPDVGFPRSRGRIHGLALWLPPGADEVSHMKARDAVLAVRVLRGPGVDVTITPREDELRPWAGHPRRWQQRSRRWATAFPVVHERRGKVRLAEVALWCRHAGLPEPVAFRRSRSPLVPGGVDLAPVEVNRRDRPVLPYSHIEIRFAEPVPGPVVLGAGRQRGLGLCVPVDD
ncbi:MAG: type I-U CRISPR-associated protein Cas5/Cas6 [Gammaproteobacteria bacterium]|nr:type I-U CRISPR-associated protein Cas5/Cas6 [Gammaproteobacteria bacterium]